jgi:exopolysaccharide biosynthesis polyprenyl glycosylphosphotransferase
MFDKSSRMAVQLERLLNVALVLAALSLASLARRELSTALHGRVPVFDFWPQASWLYTPVVLLWMAVFEVFGLHGHKAARTRQWTITAICQANLVSVVLVFSALYLARVKNIPRLLLVMTGTFDILLMWAKEIVLGHLRAAWTMRPNVVFVGIPEDFRSLAPRFRSVARWKPNVLGILYPSGAQAPAPGGAETGDTGPCLGTVDRLSEVLHSWSVDCVVMSPGHETFDQIQRAIGVCETEGVEVWLVADLFRTSVAKARVDTFQDMPMLTFSTTPDVSWALWTKRAIDLAGSVVLLGLLAPVMAAIAAAIRLGSPGAALFRQERCTLHGRRFRMLKFRTMVSGAESMNAELASRNEMRGPVFKIRDDPRVTPLGRILRRHSLDELPQLWNVLKGDMSLVGPRPPLPSEVAQYTDWQRRRLSMRSGMTCLWQVSGRNQISDLDEWARLDLEYIDRWSLWMDAGILLRTVKAVLLGTGC